MVFPSPQDATAGVLGMVAYLLLVLMTVGAVARRVSARASAPVIAGVAGRAWFWPGFRGSGMTSMRAYINAGLEATAPGVAIVLVIAGAFIAPIGALAQEAASAWLRLRSRARAG